MGAEGVRGDSKFKEPYMQWVYSGYLIVYFIVIAIWMLPSISARELLLIGAVPLVLFGSEFIASISSECRLTIKAKLKRGELTGTRLLLAGLFLGLVVFGLVGAIYFLFPQKWLMAEITISGLLIFGSPAFLVMHCGEKQ